MVFVGIGEFSAAATAASPPVMVILGGREVGVGRFASCTTVCHVAKMSEFAGLEGDVGFFVGLVVDFGSWRRRGSRAHGKAGRSCCAGSWRLHDVPTSTKSQHPSF